MRILANRQKKKSSPNIVELRKVFVELREFSSSHNSCDILMWDISPEKSVSGVTYGVNRIFWRNSASEIFRGLDEFWFSEGYAGGAAGTTVKVTRYFSNLVANPSPLNIYDLAYPNTQTSSTPKIHCFGIIQFQSVTIFIFQGFWITCIKYRFPGSDNIIWVSWIVILVRHT